MVASESAAETTTRVRKPVAVQQAEGAARRGRLRRRSRFACGLRTKRTSTATPRIAKQNETVQTAPNANGATARIAKARSGPIMAPVVSSARCVPNAAPRFSLGVVSVIIASRGAVRMPLPTRSMTTIAPIAEKAPPTTTSTPLLMAERP